MKIPVILLNYNSSEDCEACCKDLQRQQGVEIEIVIVDNCSETGELEAIKKLQTANGCTLIEAEENRGYNAGNNLGLRYAAEKGYEMALIANPDMRFPQEDYVKRLAEALRNDSETVVAASDMIRLDGRHQNPMKRDGSWTGCFNWILDILHIRNNKKDTYDFIDNYAESHPCSKVSGCCLMVNLPFLKQIGFFDENVFLYCEEAILSRQVEKAGKRMMYLADVQAIHAHKASAKGNPARRFRAWRDSRIYFIRNYSSYSAFGKIISELSMRLYSLTMTLNPKNRTNG